jgi:hypothetical protein
MDIIIPLALTFALSTSAWADAGETLSPEVRCATNASIPCSLRHVDWCCRYGLLCSPTTVNGCELPNTDDAFPIWAIVVLVCVAVVLVNCGVACAGWMKRRRRAVQPTPIVVQGAPVDPPGGYPLHVIHNPVPHGQPEHYDKDPVVGLPSGHYPNGEVYTYQHQGHQRPQRASEEY